MNKSLYLSLLIVGIITLIAVLVLKSDQSGTSVENPAAVSMPKTATDIDIGVVASTPPNPNGTCEQALETLDNYIALQDRACKVDTDCGPYYLHIHSCDPPYILAKSEFTKNLNDNKTLLGYQADAIDKCIDENDPQPFCAPFAVTAICSKGFCIDQATAANQ